MSTKATIVVLSLVIALPVIYLLSVGPVMWLIAHGYLPIATAHLYDPLCFVGGKIKVLGRFIDWYIMQMP